MIVKIWVAFVALENFNQIYIQKKKNILEKKICLVYVRKNMLYFIGGKATSMKISINFPLCRGTGGDF